MGSFTRAFILILIGINVANATDELSDNVEQLDEIAAATTEKAATFTGQVLDEVKISNDRNNDLLKIVRKTLGSTVENIVSLAVHQLTPEDAPECLTDSNEEIAKLIGSTVEEVSKCVSSPYTSITMRIENLFVLAHKATKASHSYVKRIEECKEDSEKAYCLANILSDAQGTVAELIGAISKEVRKIGNTIDGLDVTIDSCTTETVVLAFLKGIAIGLDMSRCRIEALDDKST